jgi:hypothetical protein
MWAFEARKRALSALPTSAAALYLRAEQATGRGAAAVATAVGVNARSVAYDKAHVGDDDFFCR